MLMRCPECDTRVVPIHYGHVDFAVIERTIIGDLVIAEKFGLENYYCKSCKKSFKL